MQLICSSDRLENGGKGFRFQVIRHGREESAFLIRFNGVVRGYMNRCGHVPAELDWVPGEFFDGDRKYLICSIHGALYSPESGRCVGGRCNGKGLEPIPVEERNEQVYLLEK